MVSFAVHATLAIMFNSRWWQAVAWNSVNLAFGGNCYINWAASTLTWSVCFAAQASAIGVFVTFMSEQVYKDTPYFHADKRPVYTPEQRSTGHQVFFKNVMLGGAITMLGPCWGSLTNHPLANNVPFDMDSFGHAVGARSALLKYVFLAILVQMALVLADVLYAAFHMIQHKYKPLHKYTGHSYHHNFVYPLAMCGPWLAPGDIAFSALVTFILPVEIPLWGLGFRGLSHLMGCTWQQSFFFDSLLHGYIHEMNDYGHCGKQVPVWSGFPLCPPLGFAFGLHKSIPNHESHHNFSTCGFGLLGVADWLMGTTGSPDMKSKTHQAKEE